MKKYFVTAIPMTIFALAIAFSLSTSARAQVACPQGYTCTPIAAQPAGCPLGYTCTPVVATPIPTNTGISLEEYNAMHNISSTCPSISAATSLGIGSTGDQVSTLQSQLITNGFDIPAISSGVTGKGYFGTQTASALSKYRTRCKPVTPVQNSLKIVGSPAIPANIQIGQTVSLSWTAVDSNNDNLVWSVDYGDSTGMAGTCPANTANPTFSTNHSWSNSGTYTVKVTVSDCKGNSDSSSVSVTVGGSTSNGSLKIIGIPGVPANVVTGQTVSFSWTPYIPASTNNSRITWTVDWGDNTGIAGVCPTVPAQSSPVYNSQFTASHAWSSPGTYTVKATVSDCNGNSDTNTLSVTVGNGTNNQISINSITPLSAPVGTQLILTGLGLTSRYGYMHVYFKSTTDPNNTFSITVPNGSSPVRLDFTLPAQISVTCIPEAPSCNPITVIPGTYTVTAMNADTVSTNSVQFTVLSQCPAGQNASHIWGCIGTIPVLPPNSTSTPPVVTNFGFENNSALGNNVKFFNWTVQGADSVNMYIDCHTGLSMVDANTVVSYLCGDIDRHLVTDGSMNLRFTNTSGSTFTVNATLVPLLNGNEYRQAAQTTGFMLLPQ